MIGRLSGQIVSDAPDGTLVMDVGGVGYEVLAPTGTAARARAAAAGGAEVLHVHTHVREEAFELYGFATELERKVFRLLIGVPNVGPKTALGVLSALPPPELARAVDARDVGRLNKVSGVGKKTAERLVLELREKLLKLDGFRAEAPATAPASRTAERLLFALTNMGYKPAEAERAIRALDRRLEKEPVADLLKAALAELAR